MMTYFDFEIDVDLYLPSELGWVLNSIASILEKITFDCGQAEPIFVTRLKTFPCVSDSLALSSAHEWGYEKERLWATRDEEGNSSEEKETEANARRRSSNISRE